MLLDFSTGLFSISPQKVSKYSSPQYIWTRLSLALMLVDSQTLFSASSRESFKGRATGRICHVGILETLAYIGINNIGTSINHKRLRICFPLKQKIKLLLSRHLKKLINMAYHVNRRVQGCAGALLVAKPGCVDALRGS